MGINSKNFNPVWNIKGPYVSSDIQMGLTFKNTKRSKNIKKNKIYQILKNINIKFPKIKKYQQTNNFLQRTT